MLAAYVSNSGEPPNHFADRQAIAYPDGWEFSWVYRPCPDLATLKVFIHKDGRGDYGETPECAPGDDRQAGVEMI